MKTIVSFHTKDENNISSELLSIPFSIFCTRACLKNALRKMCVTICGRFCSDEGVVVGYDNRIRTKYTAKWGVQIAGMIFQTRSRACLKKAFCKMCVTICGIFCPDEGAVAGYGN